MKRNEISIATMTWARDEAEERLLRESLTLLAQKNFTTFVSDGGSTQEFLAFLRAVPGFQISSAPALGVFTQLKTSLLAAQHSGARFILYTEPDKKLFFGSALNEFISAITTDDDVGIILAARSARSFSTFPKFQQYTETVINNLCAEVIGESGDYTYGPFLLHRQLIEYLNLIPNEIGWGWRPYIFGVARRAGLRILRVTGDYPCPPEQQSEDFAEKLYRMNQLSQSIEGLLWSAKVILPLTA